jgi:hypothetical protein
VEKMGEFFDRTIRENFPAETDTVSYKAFFNCIFAKTDHESQYILQVDRQRLSEINTELFKDENYYFFYARYLPILTDEFSEIPQDSDHRHDSVPTIMYYTSKFPTDSWWWYSFPYNPDGYLRLVMAQHKENPMIRDADAEITASRDYSMMLFCLNILGHNLREISNSTVKQLGAAVFWRYICFCGGVDLVKRKGFCCN